jgi:hypothetical protein
MASRRAWLAAAQPHRGQRHETLGRGEALRHGRGQDPPGHARFGRLKPDYRRNDVHSVALKLATVDPDGAFHSSSNGRPGVSGTMTRMMGRSKMLNPKTNKPN